MRSHVRVSLLAPLIGAILALVAVGSARSAGRGPHLASNPLFAANCKIATCGKFEITSPSLKPEEVKSTELYTQAAGHPLAGVTQFKVNTEGTFPNAVLQSISRRAASWTHVRTDVGVGVATSP